MENNREFRSVYEFEKKYFPEYVENREESVEDIQSGIGSQWAQIAIDKVKNPLIKVLNTI
jgi:hypothetical protein